MPATRLVLVLVAAVLALPLTASAQTDARATTETTSAQPVALATGGTGLVGYTATHRTSAPLEPGESLPSAVVDSRGLGAVGTDLGDVGAWLAPEGRFRSQFWPSSDLLERSYFRNELREGTWAQTMVAGDFAELAYNDVVGNAPLPWDRARGTADGELAWDAAVRRTTVTGAYGDAQGSADVVFARADLMARGGDVDARTNRVSSTLTVDLGRTYPAGTSVLANAAVFFPYTHYVADLDIRVSPETGKALLTAAVGGYLPQAREFALDGGSVNEWHIPLIMTVVLPTSDSGLVGQALLRMPEGGTAVVLDDDVRTRVEAAPGASVLARHGAAPVVLDAAGVVADARTAPPARLPLLAGETHMAAADTGQQAELTDTVLGREWASTARVQAGMTQRVPLELAGRRVGLTLDPDFRGEGVLALRDVRDLPSGRLLARAWSVPSIVVDGTTVRLDRTRLVDLRARTQTTWIGVGFTGMSGPSPQLQRVRHVLGWAMDAGLELQAVYDLGADRFAFVQWFAFPAGEDRVPRLYAETFVLTLDGPLVSASPLHYLEPVAPGPVVYNGETRATELTAPLDLRAGDVLRLGAVVLRGTTYTSPPADVTVVRAPGPLTTVPTAHPRPITDRALSVYYRAAPGRSRGYSYASLALDAEPLPAPAPRPLGQRCRPAEITDGGIADAPAAIDLQEGWFDSDGANVYATIRVADLPASAAEGTRYTWSVQWWHEHRRSVVRAELDAQGWRFLWGSRAIAGEVRPGPQGVIRLAVPRTVFRALDGGYLRDTAAHANLSSTLRVASDSAPDGSTATYGLGRDHVLGTSCA